MIQRSRYLENNLRKIVDDTLQWNGFMAHPENILVGMLLDMRPSSRTLAVKRIQEARGKDTGRLRSFVPPRIQFDAQDYVDMINWEKTVVTPPPLLADINLEEQQEIAASGKSDRKEFKIPCHTQAVERVVKEVTRAATKVCGEDERHRFILSAIQDRKLLPKFNT